MQESRYPGLEIEGSVSQQEREWKVQRVAWVILYGLLAALVLGAFGDGVLSRSVVQTADPGLRLEYDRFLHHRSSETLRFTLTAPGEQVELGIDSAYLRSLQVEQITPQPEQVIAGSDMTRFVFNARPGEQVPIDIDYRPEEVGMLQGAAALGDRPVQSFTQFVYP